MNKRVVSLVLNILIISFEIIGFLISYMTSNRIAIEFFTEESNLLLLASSIIFVYYMILNRQIPKWVHTFKFISTYTVTITLFVVLFILIPLGNFNYSLFLFGGTMLYHHTICPILAIITFLYYDNLKPYRKSIEYKGLSLVMAYALVMILFNAFDILEGPYSFLMIKKQSVFVSIIWFIIIIGFCYLISKILRLVHLKIHKEVLDVYDDNGNVINKTVLRGSDDSAFSKGEHFAVSVIFIENDKGEFLIQKLPNEEYATTGGHVLSGEKPIDSIIREVKEELGIKINKKDIEYLGYKIIDLPIRFLFYIKKNVNYKKVNLDFNEVYSVEYMSKDEIKKLIKDKKFKKAHEILYKEVLKKKK